MRPVGDELFRFAIVADAHVPETEHGNTSPFPVNRRASARWRAAVDMLNAVDVDFIVNLGDMVHPLPSLPGYPAACDHFHAISAALRHRQVFIPGNHDIGDKPSPWMPAEPVTQDALALFRERFGPDRQTFVHKGCRFVLINAPLLNSGLDDETEQRLWLERLLREAQERRIFLFLHYPVFLRNADEPDHYDNIAEPARSWLLDLICRYGVEAGFAGHVHNFWVNRWASTDLYVLPSTAFPRQDFSEMYDIAPDAEGGRNDPGKLGFAVVAVHENDHTVRIHPTGGVERAEDEPSAALPMPAAPHPRRGAAHPLGLDMRHAWFEDRQIPPSGALDEFHRKPVRNDYPLLALWRTGTGMLRIPLEDLRGPERRARLDVLARHGHRFTVQALAPLSPTDLDDLTAARAVVERLQIGVPVGALAVAARQLRLLRNVADCPIHLSPIFDRHGQDGTDGRRYHVIDHGFDPATPELLDGLPAPVRDCIDGVMFRARVDKGFDGLVGSAGAQALARGLEASMLAVLAGTNPADYVDDPDGTAEKVRLARRAAVAHPEVAIFLDTFVDVDRGYFRRAGLVDRRWNPRAGARVLQEYANRQE